MRDIERLDTMQSLRRLECQDLPEHIINLMKDSDVMKKSRHPDADELHANARKGGIGRESWQYLIAALRLGENCYLMAVPSQRHGEVPADTGFRTSPRRKSERRQ